MSPPVAVLGRRHSAWQKQHPGWARLGAAMVLVLLVAASMQVVTSLAVGAIYAFIFDYPFFILWPDSNYNWTPPAHAPPAPPPPIPTPAHNSSHRGDDSSGLPLGASIFVGAVGGMFWALADLAVGLCVIAGVQRAAGALRGWAGEKEALAAAADHGRDAEAGRIMEPLIQR